MNHIHYVGSDSAHDSKFVFDIPQGHHCWLLVITKTPAQFWVNGDLKLYPAHSAILYRAHQKIYYKACADEYVNDWIRFESDEPYVSNTSLPFGIPFSIEDPDYCGRIFELLVVEHNFNRDYKKSSIDCLLRTLFNKLLESYYQDSFTMQHYEILRLRAAIQTAPANHWTVPKMANSLRISPGYLQSIYKKTFGISCMEDVISCRIRLAKEYLFQGSQTVNEVAYRCGYQNVEHFCRQFKKIPAIHQENSNSKPFIPNDFRKNREGDRNHQIRFEPSRFTKLAVVSLEYLNSLNNELSLSFIDLFLLSILPGH